MGFFGMPYFGDAVQKDLLGFVSSHLRLGTTLFL